MVSAPAVAQTPEERAGARAAAEAGLNAFDKKHYAKAIDLLKRAEALVHAPIHLLYIARSQAELGRLVRARETYLELTREKLSSRAPRVWRDAIESGERELQEIEERLPFVSVVVQGDGSVDEVRVTRNGRPIPQALLGVPHPVDPGEYEFQAFAEGMESTKSSLTLTEGAKETVVLTLRPVPGGSGSDGGGSGEATESPVADSGTSSGGGGVSGLQIGAYLSFGVGAIGAGVGTFFLIEGSNTSDQSESLFKSCNPGCTDDDVAEIEELDDEAAKEQGLGIGGLALGGVGLATGITLLIIDAGSDSGTARSTEPPAPELRPVIGYGYLGLAGTF